MTHLIQGNKVIRVRRLFAVFYLFALCNEMRSISHVKADRGILYGFQVTSLRFVFRDQGGINDKLTSVDRVG
jgi:hypothetical protein